MHISISAVVLIGFAASPAALMAAPINGAGLVSRDVIFGSGNDNGTFTGVDQVYGDVADLGEELPVLELGLRA